MKYVRGSITGKEMSIKIIDDFDATEREVSVAAPADGAIFTLIEAAISEAEFGDELVFVTPNPVALGVYDMYNQEHPRWGVILNNARALELALAVKNPTEKEFRAPVRYTEGDFVAVEEPVGILSQLDIDAMSDLQGQYANGGRLVIEDDEENLFDSNALFRIIVMKSVSIGTEVIMKDGIQCLGLTSRYIGDGDNRLTRMFELVVDPTIKVTEVETLKGDKLRVQGYTQIFRSRDANSGAMDPLIIFEGAQRPPKWVNDEVAWLRYNKSIEIIKNGLTLGGARYQFCMVSAAGQRTVTAIFCRRDISVPKSVLEMLPAEYRDGAFSTLTEIEKLYDVISYGTYLLYKGREGNANKFNSRFGQALSTSIDCGPVVARTIGRVRVPYSKYIGDAYRSILTKKYGFSKERAADNVQLLRRKWKEDAADGFNLIGSVAALRLLGFAGITNGGKAWTEKTIVGMGFQFRYATVKGMALVVPTELLDGIAYYLEDETLEFPYRGFELICEANSVKAEWNSSVYTGELAPTFELVGITKENGSSLVDAQLITCMRFTKEEDAQVLKDRIAKNYKIISDSVGDIREARSRLGISGRSYCGDEILHPYKCYRSILEGYLQLIDQDEGPVDEPYIVRSISNNYFGFSERAGRGRVRIDGERWRIVPDPTVFWKGNYVRTGRTDFLSGKPMFDIVVDADTDVALKSPYDVYAGGHLGKLAMYRNPLNIPGEIVHSNGVSLDTVTDEWAKQIFAGMRSSVVLSVFSASANLMGGGDFDGDIAMVIWDEAINSLLYPDDFVLIEVESASKTVTLSYETLRDNFANSLCNAGIGVTTNCGTTWSELAHIVRWLKITKPEVVKLPKVWVPNYNMREDSEPYHKQHLWDTFFRTSIKNPGIVVKAKAALSYREGTMPDWEKAGVRAIVKLEEFEHFLKRDSLKYEEFEQFADVFLDACNGAVAIVRYIQELAINTAKSDVWAFYDRAATGELVPNDRYEYVVIGIRPFWKRDPERRNTFVADYTPMGIVSSYTSVTYNTIYKNLIGASTPIRDLTLPSTSSGLYKKVDAIVVQYNAEKKVIALRSNNSSTDGEDISRMYSILNQKYKSIMSQIIMENNPLNVLRCAYTATYAHADRKLGTSMGFVYSVMGEEFLIYINNSSTKGQVIQIPVHSVDNSVLETKVYTAEFDPTIRKSVLYEGEKAVGLVSCKPNLAGTISVYSNEERSFAQIRIARKKQTIRNKDFGNTISVLGLKAYDCNERLIVDMFRAKVGAAAEKHVLKLGEHQDVIHFNEYSTTDSNGLTIQRIAVIVGGKQVGDVAPEHIPYVRRIMEYGDIIIGEWAKSGRAFATSSTRLKIVDAIVR